MRSVLKCRICALTPMAMAMNMTRIHHASATNTVQYISVIHTRLTETIFTRKGIALFSRKFFIYGPRCLCDINHSYSLLELCR